MTRLGTPRIDWLPAGRIHAVGAAGLETASMVRYMVEGGRDDIILHDQSKDFDASFRAAHRFQPEDHRARSRAALARCRELRAGDDYLAGIEQAAAILVPVSWFLHPANARLDPLQDRFVNYPDACFDLWRGPVIGVTGTCGKTTTSMFAATLTGGLFCGNDRESVCDLAELADQPAERCMAFEVSNRHLRNGFRRVLDVGVLTGITLNHEPDHGSFRAYRQVKYSMAVHCHDFLHHTSVAATFPDAAGIAARGRSYGPGGAWRLVDQAVTGPDDRACSVPGADGLPALDRNNVLAAAAAALLVGIPADEIDARSPALTAATPQYRHTHREVAGRRFVNDSAACVPAAAAALVATVDYPFVLICGGDRQRYRPGEFDALAASVAANPHAALVCTTGPMAGHIEHALRRAGFASIASSPDIPSAVERALDVPAATVIFSPGCGTGSLYQDKYTRGEVFDDAVTRLVPGGQAVR